jgi:hypothetical protein
MLKTTKLRVKDLEGFKLGDIIAQGTTKNEPGGLNLTGSGGSLYWAAFKEEGQGWAVYATTLNIGVIYLRHWGTKVIADDNIKAVAPCTAAALRLYDRKTPGSR